MHAQLLRSQHVVLTPQTTYVTGSPNNSPTHQQQQRRTASPVELAQQFRSTSPLLQRSRAERSHVARRLLVDQHNHGASSMMHTPEQTAFHTPRQHQHSSYNNRGNNNNMGYFVSGFNHYPMTTTTTTPGHHHRDIQLLSAQETKERMVLEVQQGVIRNGIVEQSRAALKQLSAMTPYQRRVQARRERHGMSPEGSGRSPTPQSGKKTPTMRKRTKGEEERRPPWNNTAVGGGGVPKDNTIDDTEKKPTTATTKRPPAVSDQNNTLKRTQQHQATTTEWLSLHCDLYESQFIGYGQVILQAHNQVLLNASKSIARLAFREVGILSEALMAVGEELHDVKLEKDELMHVRKVVDTTKAGTQISAASDTRNRTVLKRSTSLLDEYAKSALSKNNDEAEDDEGIAMEYVNAAAQRKMLAVGGPMQKGVIDKHHHHDGDADNNASMLTTTANTAAVADPTANADDVQTGHDEAVYQYHTISQPGAATPAPLLTHTNDNGDAAGNAVEVVYETTNTDDDYLSVGAQTPTPASQHPQPHFNYTSTTATTNDYSRSMLDEDNSPQDVVVVVGGAGESVEEEAEQRDNTVAQNGWGHHHLPHHHMALYEGSVATPIRSEHNSYSAAMGSTKRVLFELPPSLASARQNSGEFVPTTAAAGAAIAPTQQQPYNSHEDTNFVRHVVHSSTGITVSTTA